MLTIDIGIMISDRAYAMALSKYLITYQPITFLVHCLDDQTGLSQFLSTYDNAICLVDYDRLMTLDQVITRDNVNQFIVLVDDLIDHQASETLSHYFLLNQYDLGGRIAASIGNRFTEVTKRQFPQVQREHTQVVAVTTFDDSETDFIEEIFAYIHPFNKHVLCISFDALSQIPDFVEENKTNSLSDVFYYLNKDPKQLSMIIEKVKCSDQTGFRHYIPKCRVGSHYFDLDSDQIEGFMTHLKSYLMYDLVLIQLPDQYTKTSIEIIKHSHKALIVTTAGKQYKRFRAFYHQPELQAFEHFTLISKGQVDPSNTTDGFHYQFPNDNNDKNKQAYVDTMGLLMNEVLT